MARCPNCGRETARTKDWACQWCGNPLLSTSYKEIPKTYRELKEERLREQKPPVPGLVAEPEPTLESQSEGQPITEPLIEPESKLKPEPETTQEDQPLITPVQEPVLELESKPTAEPEPTQEDQTTETPEAAPVPEPELKPAPEPEPVPSPELAPNAKEPDILDVESLYLILEADKAAAEAKYYDEILKVTGFVYRTVINDNLDVDYVILTGAKMYGEKRISCTFDKKYGQEIRQLNEGDTVTIQGKYQGLEANILMNDCVLVR